MGGLLATTEHGSGRNWQQLKCEEAHCLPGDNGPRGQEWRGWRSLRWLKEVYLGCEMVALRMYEKSQPSGSRGEGISWPLASSSDFYSSTIFIICSSREKLEFSTSLNRFSQSLYCPMTNQRGGNRRENSTSKGVTAMAKEKITSTLLSNSRQGKPCDYSPLIPRVQAVAQVGRIYTKCVNSDHASHYWLKAPLWQGKEFACLGDSWWEDKLLARAAEGLVTYTDDWENK